MGLISWIVLGAIAGAIGNYAVKGGFGLIATVILGVIGAVVGGFIASALLYGGDFTSINLVSLVLSIFGAILVIGFAKVFRRSDSD